VPPAVAKVPDGGFFVAPEDGVVFSPSSPLSESVKEHGVYLLSGASIRRAAGIDKADLPGPASAFWHNNKMYVFAADRGRTTASSWRSAGDTLTAEGKGAASDTKRSACNVRLKGWQRVEADAIRAVTFIKDRAYVAACRGLEVWTAADGPPRQVSVTGDDLAILYLNALDDSRLLLAGYALGSDGTTKQVVLRIIDIKNPLSPKVQQETIVVDAADGPYLDPRAVRVEGNTIALPIVFATGKTSGTVFLYRFDARGFKPISRVPYAARRAEGRPEDNQQIYLKAGRVIIVTDNFLQINRTDHPENMLFSLSR
jgi:hypothetical protein